MSVHNVLDRVHICSDGGRLKPTRSLLFLFLRDHSLANWGSQMDKRLVAVSLMTVLLAACDKPRIDTSSDERMETTIDQVRASLPEQKRAQFDTALQVVALAELDFEDLLTAGQLGTGTGIETKVKNVLEGKTGEQVIAIADSIRREREAREREQALQEIAELEGRKERAEEARLELAKFEVLRSRFYKRKREFQFMPEPIIELTVRNGTEHPISRAYFLGTIASPGRAVPWLKESFNYSIPGGLEPGERATWKLAPNAFGKWGTVDAPRDAVFTAEVQKLDGPDGEPLFDAGSFTDDDAGRLSELKAKYGES